MLGVEAKYLMLNIILKGIKNIEKFPFFDMGLMNINIFLWKVNRKD